MTRITGTTGEVKAPTKRRTTQLVKRSAAGKKSGSVGAKGFPEPAGIEAFAAATTPIIYSRAKGIDFFVDRIASATPMQIVELERRGIDNRFLIDLSHRMHIPASRLLNIIGIPKATAAKRGKVDGLIAGAAGQAALGLTRLLATAKAIVENSTADDAADFDTFIWFGHWLELPQPVLGGCKPANLLDTPTGRKLVAQVLGAIESGTYQ